MYFSVCMYFVCIYLVCIYLELCFGGLTGAGPLSSVGFVRALARATRTALDAHTYRFSVQYVARLTGPVFSVGFHGLFIIFHTSTW